MGDISVSNLGKAYKNYPSRWARFYDWVMPFRKKTASLDWILSNINFSVRSGEAVGVVGMNGAGKSTLLKMIVGTVKPTTGTVQIDGRAAALLELGMGFHPEFTGRQNVFMAGQLMGLGIDEINSLMPQIEDFAEIGDYIDQPVRKYSSGMQMRLAFSVATAKRPDLLIVDEALSVGDTYFQHKSFSRIREFREKGTTLLIVSHDRNVIQTICDKAILLNAGKLDMIDSPDRVMDYYAALLADKQEGHSIIEKKDEITSKVGTTSGTGEAFVSSISLFDLQGQVRETYAVGEGVELEIRVFVNELIPRLVLGFLIKDRLGNPVYGTNTHHSGHVMFDVMGRKELVYRFNFNLNIGVGTFSISTALVSSDNRYQNNYESKELAMIFEVTNPHHFHFVGSSWLDTQIAIDTL